MKEAPPPAAAAPVTMLPPKDMVPVALTAMRFAESWPLAVSAIEFGIQRSRRRGERTKGRDLVRAIGQVQRPYCAGQGVRALERCGLGRLRAVASRSSASPLRSVPTGQNDQSLIHRPRHG